MKSVKVQANGRVTIPKVVREQAHIDVGDNVQFQVTDLQTVEMTFSKPLEYFIDRFRSDVPYDDEAIRNEAEDEAAKWVIGE